MDAPPTSPKRYLDIENMPERFVLEIQDEDGEWWDHGLYTAESFVRCKDGAYLCRPVAGSPVWLRCVSEDGDVIEVIDGTGEQRLNRLVPFPNDRYSPPA